MLVRITQQDVVYRRYLNPSHRSYIPDFGVYIKVPGANGGVEYRALSRQLVLFCVERRKAWRMLQSKAGIENKEYKAQRSILADVDAGKISKEDLFARAEELMKERIGVPAPAPTRPPTPTPTRAAAPTPVPVPAPAVHKPPLEAAEQPRSSSVVRPLVWKQWEKSHVNDGTDDVINLGICPICEQSLRLAYPEAIHVDGQIVHATCAAKVAEQ